MKLPLLSKYRCPPDERFRSIAWSSCLPFVENRMGVLIHRPRSVATLKANYWPTSSTVVQYWCGNSVSGRDRFTFLSVPGVDQIVCARCEEKAIAAGLPSSEDLAGRHVHTGGVQAYRRCCKPAIPDGALPC